MGTEGQSGETVAGRGDRRARNPAVDNLRGLLLLLVVAGHALEGLRAKGALFLSLWTGVILVAIPGFAFVSGLVWRRPPDSERLTVLRRDAVRLLLPYVLAQFFYVGQDVLVHRPAELSPLFLLQPFIHLWFLPALFVWRASLLFFGHRPFVLLVVTLLLSLLSPYGDRVPGLVVILPYGDMLRTMTYWPFFVLGFIWARHAKAERSAASDEGKQMLRLLPEALGARLLLVRAAAVACLAAAVVVTVLWMRDWIPYGFYGNATYDVLAWYTFLFEGPLRRAAIHAVGIVAIAGLLPLAWSRGGWLARFGSATLWPYVAHYAIISWAARFMLPEQSLRVGAMQAGQAGALAAGSVYVVFVTAVAVVALEVVRTLSSRLGHILLALQKRSRVQAERVPGVALIGFCILAPMMAIAYDLYHNRTVHVRLEELQHGPGMGKEYHAPGGHVFGHGGLVIHSQRVRFGTHLEIALAGPVDYEVVFFDGDVQIGRLSTNWLEGRFSTRATIARQLGTERRWEFGLFRLPLPEAIGRRGFDRLMVRSKDRSQPAALGMAKLQLSILPERQRKPGE